MIGYTIGTYKIIEKIGEGGMGSVYHGIDIMLEREVAIKALRPELARQPELVERFRAEAKTLAKLNHPNIATVYNFLCQDDSFFMVMEFVRGETLDNTIRKSGAMPVEQAVPLFCQALEGIEHAHRLGIIHRDIKPANMMLTDTGSIKVMDFGIARVLGTARMTRQGYIVGTIGYMSPEQVLGQEGDARSDIYSLGILLYEMLTGRVPFSSQSEFELMKMQIEEAPTPPRTFAPHIPEAIEHAIMRALAKKPEMRFQTASEFRCALLSSLESATAVRETPTLVVSSASTPKPSVKETRLARPAEFPSRADAAAEGEVKATRLAADQAQPAYGQAAAAQLGHPAPAKFNWKILVAAVVLVVLASVLIVLMMSRGKKEAASQLQPTPVNVAPAPSALPPVTTPEQTKPPVGSQIDQPPITLPEQTKPPIGPQIDQPLSTDTPSPPRDSKQTKVSRSKSNKTADAAAQEKARRAAEARKLLEQ
jgi:serine/threonine protein kinase